MAQLDPTDATLRVVLGMQRGRSYPHPDNPNDIDHVYTWAQAGEQPKSTPLRNHTHHQPALVPAGYINVAFRGSTLVEREAWARQLRELRLPNSGIVDRYSFCSIYCHKPNGIIFELATDEPGFTVDEPVDKLGKRLALPPFRAPHRAAIEADLPPLSD